MHAMPGSKTCNALHRRGAGDPAVEQKVENRSVDRNVVMRGSIAHVERDFYSLACSQHGPVSACFCIWPHSKPRSKFLNSTRSQLPIPSEQRMIEAPLWASC